MVLSSCKLLFQWLLIASIYLLITVGWALFGLLMASDDPSGGYLTFIISVGLSIMLIFWIAKNLRIFWKNPQRSKKLLEKHYRNIHIIIIQDSTVLYVAWKKAILLIPFLLSLILIGVFVFLTFKLNLFLAFSSIFPNTLPSYLRFFGAFYIFNFICMTIYMTGYFMTGEMLQRMFGKAKRNILVDVLFNYFYAIPFLLILTLLWVIFVLFEKKRKNEYPSLDIWSNLRSLSLYALFKAFQYYTYINLARISFSDIGVSVNSEEAKSLFTDNIGQLLKIFIRAGAFLALAFVFGIAIAGWNSVLGFLSFSDLFDYIPLLASVLFFLLLIGLFSEQLAILFYYIKFYHPSSSFEKIGLNLDSYYLPKKHNDQIPRLF